MLGAECVQQKWEEVVTFMILHILQETLRGFMVSLAVQHNRNKEMKDDSMILSLNNCKNDVVLYSDGK